MVASGTVVAGMAVGFSPVASAAAGNGEVTITAPSTPGISSLDPSAWAAQILVDQGTILEGLYGYNQKNQVVPKIASGYKVSKDGLTWTIMLRHNAKWSNGDPVTANDFYYAWMRQLDPKNSQAQIWAGVLNYVKNGYAYHSGGVPASQVGIKVVNPYELQITTTTPHAILGELAVSSSMPLDQKAIEANPNWALGQGWVSDAPFTVKSFTPNGTLTLVRNTKYVGAPGQVNEGNAQTINIVPGTTVAVEDYMAGKIDAALVGTSSDLQYIKTHNLNKNLHETPNYSMTYLEWDNSAVSSPYDKVQVRQAIAEALERKPIVQSVLSGMGGVTTKFSVPGWPTWNDITSLPENLANAKKLLAQAGYPNGKGLPPIYLYAVVAQVTPQAIPVAEAVSEELKQNLGIQSKIVQLNQTDDNWLTYEGPKKGIQAGYNIGVSSANWSEPAEIDLGGSQGVYFPGDYGWTPKQTQEVLPWYNTAYDPTSVKKYGDPTKSSEGVNWSDWSALVKEEKSDVAYLLKWEKTIPKKWYDILNPPGGKTYQQQWNSIVQAWKTAKTAAAKHAAYVLAWEFIAPESATSTSGGVNTGALDVLVWWDKNESKDVENWRMWQAYMQNAQTNAQAAPYTGKLLTQLDEQGYAIPLYYNETYYLERSNVTGVQPNPWAWGNFYQFQYLSVK